MVVELGAVPWDTTEEGTSVGTGQGSRSSREQGRGQSRPGSRSRTSPARGAGSSRTGPGTTSPRSSSKEGRRIRSKEAAQPGQEAAVRQSLLSERRDTWLQGALEVKVGAPTSSKSQRLARRIRCCISPKRGSVDAGSWRHCYIVLGPDGLAFWPPAGPQAGPPEGAFRFIELQDVTTKGVEVTLRFKNPLDEGKEGDNDSIVLRADSESAAQRWGTAVREAMVAKLVENLPSSWDVTAIASSERFVSKQSLSQDITPIVQRLIDHCFVCKSTRDRKRREMPLRLQVTEVVRVENSTAWIAYDAARTRLQGRRQQGEAPEEELEPPILTMALEDEDLEEVLGCLESDEDVREHWLFHGTTAAAVQGISDSQFRLDLAGSHRGTMYGNGVYLAECSSKADEYSEADQDGNCRMLLCRVALGRMMRNCDRSPKGKVLEAHCREQGYDSLCGDREAAVGTYREFVLYDSSQVYPAYIVHYRRVMQPEFLRLLAQGKGPGTAFPDKEVVLHAAKLAEEHPDSVVRYRILLLLGNGAGKVVPALSSILLEDERTPSRRTAAAVLRQLATSLAPTASLAPIDLSSEALGANCMIAAIPALLGAAQNDVDEEVRESAAAALQEIKGYPT